MIRTFSDRQQTPHTLDLDAALIDGVSCLDIQADEHSVLFETAQGTIACELAQFWQQIAGHDLSAREATLLLAECLARQIILQRQNATLEELRRVLSQRGEATTSSLQWLTTRLQPLEKQAMAAYDGTPAMTEAIARIVQQDPSTIRAWAHQLGLDASSASAQSEGSPTALPPVPSALVDAETRPAAEIPTPSKHFRWTPERQQQLEQALITCTGPSAIERARQIAYEFQWPIMAVRSKLYEMQRPRRAGQSAAREPESTEAAKEGDRHADQCEAAPV